ncbi:hypothetical protein VTN49DRAFT_1093 [Thermomyces lanuginosus]|uniref:uncharacterized protein n=1 Tax=Thermomyces lanuginosus TaxID=5541 RepID=UPI0037430C9F
MCGSRRRFYILSVAIILASLFFFSTRLQYASLQPLSVQPHEEPPEKAQENPPKLQEGSNNPQGGLGGSSNPQGGPSNPQEGLSSSEQKQVVVSPRCSELRFEDPDIKLSPRINYNRRCIKPKFDDSIARYDRGDGRFIDRVVNLTGPLITEKTPVNLEACDFPEFTACDDAIELPVQRPYPEKKFDEFIFGVATTYERLEMSIPQFKHWLADTGAPLVGLVIDKEDEVQSKNLDFSRLVQAYADAGMTLKIARPHGPDHTVEQSHMMVIRDMLAHIDAEGNASGTRWLGVLDDDTFFPSLYPLLETLSHYDHTVPTYLGAVSEHLELSRIGGPGAAYGGAGIFLSVPLAHEISPHLDSCLTKRGGDMQIMECIHDHSHARLFPVVGLQQTDMAQDLSGFFESGWRYLSFHHWKSWFHEPVEKQAAVVHLCGDCYLQRYTFEDNAVLTNGYSINVYPKGFPDFSRIEGTWENAIGERRLFQWSMGPLRPPMSKEDKKQYKLLEAFTTEDGTFRQIFVHKGDQERQEVDEVIDLVWQL